MRASRLAISLCSSSGGVDGSAGGGGSVQQTWHGSAEYSPHPTGVMRTATVGGAHSGPAGRTASASERAGTPARAQARRMKSTTAMTPTTTVRRPVPIFFSFLSYPFLSSCFLPPRARAGDVRMSLSVLSPQHAAVYWVWELPPGNRRRGACGRPTPRTRHTGP